MVFADRGPLGEDGSFYTKGLPRNLLLNLVAPVTPSPVIGGLHVCSAFGGDFYMDPRGLKSLGATPYALPAWSIKEIKEVKPKAKAKGTKRKKTEDAEKPEGVGDETGQKSAEPAETPEEHGGEEQTQDGAPLAFKKRTSVCSFQHSRLPKRYYGASASQVEEGAGKCKGKAYHVQVHRYYYVPKVEYYGAKVEITRPVLKGTTKEEAGAKEAKMAQKAVQNKSSIAIVNAAAAKSKASKTSSSLIKLGKHLLS